MNKSVYTFADNQIEYLELTSSYKPQEHHLYHSTEYKDQNNNDVFDDGDKILVMTDLCFCEFTDHGHCGIINPHLKTVDNEATLEISAKQAIVHAKAGADMLAPSGMMDGVIESLRNALDNEGFKYLPIMS